MRHQPFEEPAGTSHAGSADSNVAELQSCDVRRLSTDQLVSELADLEQRIQLLDPDDTGDLARATMQDLVEAQYTILRELRRREHVPSLGQRWTVLSRRFGRAE